jgi:hypothetical protein
VTVYRSDLKRHPKNVWALHGLAESIEKQDRATEAAETEPVLIPSSFGSLNPISAF